MDNPSLGTHKNATFHHKKTKKLLVRKNIPSVDFHAFYARGKMIERHENKRPKSTIRRQRAYIIQS